MMKLNLNLLKFLVLALFLGACSNDDDTVTTPIDNDTVNTEGDDKPDGIVAKAIDTKLFSQIQKVDEALTSSLFFIINRRSIWEGYNLTNKPMYLVHKNAEGKVDRGYVVNPKSFISGSTVVPEGENATLNIVRYDAKAQEAFDLIEGDMGNGLYDFNFEIDGEKVYYTQIYTDEEVLAGEELAAYPGGFFNPEDVTFGSIDFIIHEPFHEFQDNWTFNRGSSLPNMSQELLELRALTHQIFKNFPNEKQDATTLENKLRQFVAIRSAENKLLGSDMASEGEKLEGTARYVEKTILRYVFPNRATESFITGSVTDNDYGITSQEILAQVIENLQYEIGASAYVAMNELIPNAQSQIEAGKNQFEIARDYFTMTEAELKQQLIDAKHSVDFTKIQMKAKEWVNL